MAVFLQDAAVCSGRPDNAVLCHAVPSRRVTTSRFTAAVFLASATAAHSAKRPSRPYRGSLFHQDHAHT